MAIQFYFLFSNSYSGTTVMSRYLETQTGAYLPPFGNNEGQMVPELREEMRVEPWNPDYAVDWTRVKQVWERLATEAGASAFIEASPPNTMRMPQVLEAFGPQAQPVFSSTDPYAWVASAVFKQNVGGVSREKLENLAGIWIRRSKTMRKHLEACPDMPRITYEGFCADPTVLNRALSVPIVDAAANFVGKNNDPVRGIVNLNRRHFATLSFNEWDAVSEVFAKQADLLEYFGYALRTGREIVEDSLQDPVLHHAGVLRRAMRGGGAGSGAQRRKKAGQKGGPAAKAKARRQAKH